MEKWSKNREIKLWTNSDRVTPEFLYQLICGVEVSMFNKFHLLLTTTCQLTENFTFIESVEVVGSVEKE